MIKRVATALLWLFAVAWAGNFLTAYLGVPQVIGGVVASATALFVGVDPLHLLWDASPLLTPTQIRDRTPVVSRISSQV